VETWNQGARWWLSAIVAELGITREMVEVIAPYGERELTIADIYAILRSYGNGRWRALRYAITIDWAAWRYSRALQMAPPPPSREEAARG